MTVRHLVAACRAAGLRLDGSGPSLKVSPSKTIPPELRPWLLLLATGVRAMLRDAAWWGTDRDGHATGPGSDGALSFDRELPPTTVRLAVAGDPPKAWDRCRGPDPPAARQAA